MATITLTNPDGSALSLSVEAFQAVSAQGGSTIVSVGGGGRPDRAVACPRVSSRGPQAGCQRQGQGNVTGAGSLSDRITDEKRAGMAGP
jgi:hypothetical protein